MEAIQFTMNYDASVLEFVNLESAYLEAFSGYHYAHFEEKGAVTVSYGREFLLEEGLPLFQFSFRVKQAGMLSDLLKINSKITAAAAYTSDEFSMEVGLDYQEEEWVEQTFQLYQNRPNPFRDKTEVSFYLPQSGEVVLKVFNLSGSPILEMREAFPAGLSQIELSDERLGTGVYYYQLQTDYGAMTKKMVRIR